MPESRYRVKRMDKLLITLVLFALSLAGCDLPPAIVDLLGNPPAGAIDPLPTHIAPAPADIDWDDRSPFRAGLITAAQSALNDLPGATEYRIDLQIPADFGTMQGEQQVRYTNREDVSLNEIYFRLFPNTAGGALKLSALHVNGQDAEIIYEYEDSALRVPLTPALPPGHAIEISMRFTVDIPREMGGNYGLFGYFDDILVLDQSCPVIPVYDDEGWNVETPPPNADVSYMDAGFYLVRVTAPANLTLVSSGIEIGREYPASDTQMATIAAGPIRDFYLAASHRFTVISTKVGETTINSYSAPDGIAHARVAMEVAANALKSYGVRLGVYPYTEFDIVSTPMLALGMEYPGMTAIALMLYAPNRTAGGLPTRVQLEAATAHEVAHQWFYNVVASDQIDEPWLDEAIVQYLTSLYYMDTSGAEAADSYVQSWYGRWDRVNRADMPIGLPAGDYDGSQYSAIVYGRGPIFVATLAETMGQETFDEFLRDYYQTNKWGIGASDEFKQLAEEHCGCDLTPLFEEWVHAK
jgi:hypothetical protein